MAADSEKRRAERGNLEFGADHVVLDLCISSCHSFRQELKYIFDKLLYAAYSSQSMFQRHPNICQTTRMPRFQSELAKGATHATRILSDGRRHPM